MATNIGTAFFNVTFNTAAARREITALVSNVNRNLGLLGGIALVGTTAAIAGLVRATAEIGAAAIQASVEYEQAFASVRKTVDDGTLSAGEAATTFGRLSEQLRDLALEVPLDLEEDIASIAALGGQLGIPADQLTEFTRIIGEVGVTTNVAVDDAATSFARLANIMGLSEKDFRGLGDTVVNLGNKLPAQEDEILRFANRIAAAGEIAGFSADEVLAVGAAMASVGVPSERGGTAIQRTWIKITDAVANGGEVLDLVAQVSGETSEQFQQHWETDAAGAWVAFVEGLGRTGTDAFKILRDLGLNDQRVIQSLLSLSNAGDLMSRTFGFAADDLGAMGTEADIFFNTTAGKMQLLQNRLHDVSITLGDQLSPTFNTMIDTASEWLATNQGLFDTLGENLKSAFEGLLPVLEQALDLAGRFALGWTDFLASLGESTITPGGTELTGTTELQEFEDFLERGLLFDPHIANLLEILPGRIEGAFGQLTLVEEGLRNALEGADSPEDRITALATAFIELDHRLKPLGESITQVGFDELTDELKLTEDQLRTVIGIISDAGVQLPQSVLAALGLVRAQTRVPRGRGGGEAPVIPILPEEGFEDTDAETDRIAKLLEAKQAATTILRDTAGAFGVSVDVILANWERLAPGLEGVFSGAVEGLDEASFRTDLFRTSLENLRDAIDFRPATEGLFGIGDIVNGIEEATRTLKESGDEVALHGRDVTKNIIANMNEIAAFEANLVILFARGFENLAQTLAEAGPTMGHVAEDFVNDVSGADSAAAEAALESGGVISDELQTALDEALASGDVPQGLLDFVQQLGSDQVQKNVYDEGFASGQQYGTGFQAGLISRMGWLAGFLGLLPRPGVAGPGSNPEAARRSVSVPNPAGGGSSAVGITQNFFTEPAPTPQTQQAMQQAAGVIGYIQ